LNTQDEDHSMHGRQQGSSGRHSKTEPKAGHKVIQQSPNPSGFVL